MNATKTLWGQVLFVSAAVLAFVWAAMERTAWKLGFQSQLGRPWFDLLGWPVYQPPAFFWWWIAYDAYARDVFVEGAYIAASGGIATAKASEGSGRYTIRVRVVVFLNALLYDDVVRPAICVQPDLRQGSHATPGK